MTDLLEGVFQPLDLDKLHPSKSNPRKHYDKAEDAELAASVKAHGVLQAILVRPLGEDGHFEIVAGHRRWRAAKTAALGTIPAQVRTLSDDQALEIQLIENLQRADVHPLDEAEGYAVLLKHGKGVGEISAEVGKSQSYIYQRLKLAELVADAKAAFREGRISASHAILIAREQPAGQQRALNHALGIYGGDRRAMEKARKEGEAAVGVRELARFIDETLHLDLEKAPFPVADALLIPKAGACTSCPKRTGFNPALFADIESGERCTDLTCYQQKVQAHVQGQVTAIRGDSGPTPVIVSSNYSGAATSAKGAVPKEKYAEIDKKADACAFTRVAVLGDGAHAGKEISVCADPKCRVHFDKSGHRKYPTEPREKQAVEKRDDNLAILRQTRQSVLGDILGKPVKRLRRADWIVLAVKFFEGLPGTVQSHIYERRDWKPKVVKHEWYEAEEYGDTVLQARLAALKEPEFNRFLIECAVTPEASIASYEASGKDKLPVPFAMAFFGPRAGANYRAVESKVRKELEAKRRNTAKRAEKKEAEATAKKARRGGGTVPVRVRKVQTDAKPVRAKGTHGATMRRVKATRKGVNRGKAKK